ncbi:hypothetical protein Tco_0411189 [Tanacetum coccineum]
MQDSPPYKTYLAFTIGATTLKKAIKFKKHAFPSKKKDLVAVKKPADNPVKKPAAKRQSAGGLSEGPDFESEVPNEPKGNEYESWGDNNDDDQHSNDERTESDNTSSSDDEEETKEDEYVHTPEDYVHTDDETNDESKLVDKEEYERISEELYGDVNVRLTDVELADEEKSNEEMTHAEQVYAEHEEVSQEVTGDQAKDDAQTTVTAALATEVPLQNSSISSDYATKFLNFDNIPSEFLGTNLDDALYKVLKKHDADIIKEFSVPKEISIIEDKDAMDKGVTDQLKKRKLDDAKKDEGPFAGLDRGLKR